jgi:protein-S-isoprenylcysteine O-methyltransferase Ste14
VLFLKNLLFAILVPGTMAVYVPWLMGHRCPIRPGAWRVAAAILFLAGTSLVLTCVWDFMTRGRGTPMPLDPPKELVVEGPYRYVRNPMYVGVLLVLLGWTVLFRSLSLLIYVCCVATAFHLVVVFYEEPHLQKVFGTPYQLYCSRVGRWLPRPPPSRTGKQ